MSIIESKQILNEQPPTPTLEPVAMLADAFTEVFTTTMTPGALMDKLVQEYVWPRYETQEDLVKAGVTNGSGPAAEELKLILKNPNWREILKVIFRSSLTRDQVRNDLAESSGLSPDQLTPELVDAAVDLIYDRPDQDSSD